MNRRTFIEGAGATALAGVLAGCFDEQGQTTEAVNPDETGTVTETGGDVPDIEGSVEDVPAGLKVTNRELYQTDGEVGLRGTVKNTGEDTFGWVEADVTLQDDQGELLYEFIDETEEEEVDDLAPGEKWQFDVVFQEAQMAEVTAYTIDLDTYQLPGTPGPDRITGEIDQVEPNLEIVSHDLSRQESTTYVTGAVRNVGEEEIESVEVSVILYDDNDNELLDLNDTVEQENDVQQLAPGETWTFQVKFQDPDIQSIDRYVINADSTVV